jgi:hypothetical protein
VAIDWGRQPWDGGRRAGPGQWSHQGQPGQPGQAGQDDPRRRRPRVAIAALILGAVALVFSGYQVYSAIMPRKFTSGQQRQIVAWEVASRWRELPAGTIFPPSATYPPPQQLQDGGTLTLTARRLGIARQVACQQGTDTAAALVLGRGGCEAVLRATYVDGTGSFLVTIGVAAFPTATEASAAQRQLSASSSPAQAGALAPGVEAVPFAGTLASGFTDARRQLSGSLSAGPYVVLYAIGYADGRPKVAVAGDGYTLAEMTSLGQGLAGKIADGLAASPPAPHCPGVPGC